MTERLTFRSAAEYEPGTVYVILAECYADILDTALQDSLSQFDREVFAAPDTVGACALISSIGDETVGFLSYDPRQGPEIGLVGHNGVLPAFQGRGYGTQQILEIIRLFTSRQFACARVSTSEHPFFTPARKMYERCGFRQCGRDPNDRWRPYGVIHYEKPLIVPV
jgi:RimJ/RimL family protein N-acetyltransferase